MAGSEILSQLKMLELLQSLNSDLQEMSREQKKMVQKLMVIDTKCDGIQSQINSIADKCPVCIKNKTQRGTPTAENSKFPKDTSAATSSITSATTKNVVSIPKDTFSILGDPKSSEQPESNWVSSEKEDQPRACSLTDVRQPSTGRSDILTLGDKVEGPEPKTTENSRGFKISDIKPTSKNEEDRQIARDLDRIKSIKGITEGISIKELESSDGDLNKSNYRLVLYLGNLLNVSMFDCKSFFIEKSTNFFRPAPAIVTPGMKEVLAIQDSIGFWGMLSFMFGMSHLQVIVHFGIVDDGLTYLSLGLAPVDVPMDRATFDFLYTLPQSGNRLDVKRCKYDGKGGRLFVKCGPFRAAAKLSTGAQAIMRLDIGSVEGLNYVMPPPHILFSRFNLPTVSGGSESGGSRSDEQVQELDILVRNPEIHPGTYGCVLEINNALNVELEDHFGFLRTGSVEDPIPGVVSSLFSEIIKFESSNVEGLFMYRLGSTDLRVAIALRVKPPEHPSFAIGFFTDRKYVNARLYNLLMRGREWRSRTDRKFAKARDGEQVIEIWNVVAQAKMLMLPQAILQFAITTY